jgi:hypothetical protein
VRGIAIKLLGVPGDKIVPEEREAETQDFVLVSQPVFFVADVSKRRHELNNTAHRQPSPHDAEAGRHVS